MKCPLCNRDISAGMLDCGSHRSVPLSTNPDPLQAALQLAKEQLDSRIESLAQATDVVSKLGDFLRSLSTRLGDAQVSLIAAIQAADKLKALLSQQK